MWYYTPHVVRMLQLLLLSILGSQLTLGHICLLSPRQRGALDISTPASHTCFRHSPPCGGEDVESPRVVYTQGQMAFIHWQQNLNHYEPGYPGYMDLAIADSPDSTDFRTMAVVADRYVYAQWHQQNFTALVKIPDIKCEHCVIRARYNAHKPGETPFLQCADVKIASPADFDHEDTKLKYNPVKHLKQQRSSHLQPLKRALIIRKALMKKNRNNNKPNMAPMLYGFAFNPFEPNQCQYVMVDTSSGKMTPMGSTFDFGVDSINMKWTENPTKPPGRFMVDEVLSVDFASSSLTVLLHTTGSRDDTAGSMALVDMHNTRPVAERNLSLSTGGAINALTWRSTGMRTAFRILKSETAGSFYFEVGSVDDMGMYTMEARMPKPEPLYVNFQWLEADVSGNGRVYALLGNENAPEALNARLYTFDISQKKYIGFVELDVNNYTFMSVHSHPSTSNKLFAFSPGLWTDGSHEWNLVAIDLTSGKVTKQCHIAPAGVFMRYYGGSVRTGRPSQATPLMYHVLRVQDSEADMIVAVNPVTCAVTFSEATNVRHVHSLVLGST